jgi:hypothetical protein
MRDNIPQCEKSNCRYVGRDTTLHFYPSNTSVSGPQNLCGRYEGGKDVSLVWNRSPAVQTVAMPTELSRLPYEVISYNNSVLVWQ